MMGRVAVLKRAHVGSFNHTRWSPYLDSPTPVETCLLKDAEIGIRKHGPHLGYTSEIIQRNYGVTRPIANERRQSEESSRYEVLDKDRENTGVSLWEA